MKAVRAFFAVDLDDATRRAAADVTRALRERPGGDGVRWVRPESLHVTLRFLGEIDPDVIPPLVGRVTEQCAAERPFRLALGAAHGFPTARRPRVVVLDAGPEERLAALAGAVERGVVASGFEPEPRPFRAHLTLGRVRQRSCPATDGVAPPGDATCDVCHAVLFRSELGPSGARYTPLERIPLGAPGGTVHPLSPDRNGGQ